MSAVPGPLLRALAPPGPAATSPGWETVTETLARSVPHEIELTPALSLVLVVPTGVASAWQDAALTAIVSNSEAQTRSSWPGASLDDVATAPARLVLRSGQREAGIVPLIAGSRQRLPAAGAAVLEVQLLAWVLHAGTLVGPGDFGSSLTFAWRAVGAA